MAAERLTDAQWDALMARVNARLRAWSPALADALEEEERGERELTEEQKATLDAFMGGTGYLVSGRRVDPSLVTIFRGPGPERYRAI